MPRYQGLPPIGQGRSHDCQTWMPPRIRLYLSHILARIILSYRHSIGCSQAKDRQSAGSCYVKYRVDQSMAWSCFCVSVSLFLSMLVVAFLCCVLLCFCKGVSPCRRRGFASWPRSYLVNLRASALRCIYNPLFWKESHEKISIALPILLGFKLWNVLNFLYVSTRALYTGHIQKLECVSDCLGWGIYAKHWMFRVWVFHTSFAVLQNNFANLQ